MIKEALFILNRKRCNSEGVPLPLVRIHDKPFIELWLRYLDSYACPSVHFMTDGLNPELFRLYSSAYLSFRISYMDMQPVGKIASEVFRVTGHKLRAPLLVVFPDYFFNVNLKRFEDYHQQKEADLSVAMRVASEDADEGSLLVEEDYRIAGERSKDDNDLEEYTHGGMFLTSPSTLSGIYAEEDEFLTPDVIIRNATAMNIYGMRCFSDFIDIRRYAGIEQARMQMYLYGD